MAGFFELNIIIIIFLYGIIFFLMGFGILLKNKQHSRFKLVKALKWLALFGIVHAIADWGHLFIPIQKDYSSPELYVLLKSIRIIINTASFVFLLQFGISLLVGMRKLPEKLSFLPGILFVLWLAQFLIYNSIFGVPDHELLWVRISDIWSRYLFALPGALLTGYGILIQKEEFIALGHDKFINVLNLASVSFIIYGIAAGFFVPEGPVLLAQAINADVFFQIVGFPIELIRAGSGLLMAISILKLIQVFDQEYLNRLRESQKEKTVYEERNRFAQDLHDGIIQSMYAMNLQLDVVKHLLDKDVDLAKEKLDVCLEKRNGIIHQVREYIGELRRTTEERQSLENRIVEIIEELGIYERMEFEFRYDYHGEEIPMNLVYHITHILKEAIVNVVKHAQATSLTLLIDGEEGVLYLELSDNGIGFSDNAIYSRGKSGTKQGIKNIKDRVRALNGQIKIKSSKKAGTRITIHVPIEGGELDD